MKQVLIIDDAAEDLELLSTLVEHSPNTTAIAFSNGADGFEYFRTYGADCILLDHRLNGEDGLALVDAFRSQSLFLPLILTIKPRIPPRKIAKMRGGMRGLMEAPNWSCWSKTTKMTARILRN